MKNNFNPKMILVLIKIFSCSLFLNAQNNNNFEYTLPVKDSLLVYDNLIGETYNIWKLAEGWRNNTKSGSGNTVYKHPYMPVYSSYHNYDDLKMERNRHDSSFVYYYFKSGERYTGEIVDSCDRYGFVFKGHLKDGLLQDTATYYFLCDYIYSLPDVFFLKVEKMTCIFKNGEPLDGFYLYFKDGTMRKVNFSF
jgi:hypothetical protein